MVLENGYMSGDGRSPSPDPAFAQEPTSLSQNRGNPESTTMKPNQEPENLSQYSDSTHSTASTSSGPRASSRGLRGSRTATNSGGLGRGLRGSRPNRSDGGIAAPGLPPRNESNDSALLQPGDPPPLTHQPNMTASKVEGYIEPLVSESGVEEPTRAPAKHSSFTANGDNFCEPTMAGLNPHASRNGEMGGGLARATVPGAVAATEPPPIGMSTGVGGAPQGKMRMSSVGTTRPGAVSVVEPSMGQRTPGVSTGVGGAPQGKLRRTIAPSRPGAVSVVEPAAASASSNMAMGSTGVGGAPQGKMRRTTSPTRPGAVSVVEPATASDASIMGSTGVGGAPQGKMRRTTSPTRPGAVSVVEPVAASAPSTMSTVVGGAPQGKMRRTTSPTRPGAVSVVEPAAASAPSNTAVATAGVGGAPQGKMRRTTSPTRPGAVSVVEPASNMTAGSTGVGGAPQGKMRRSTAVSTPGAVSVVEPAAGSAPSNKAAVSTGVGGAPHGKFRRSPAASTPGAVSVVEPAPASASSNMATGNAGVGGAPQGKLRRTTSPSRPGAVSVVETNVASAASTGVGSAPEGKMRRTTTSPTKPGAVSVVATAAMPPVGEGVGIDTGAEMDEADPQAVRRKQIQAVMKDTSMSQQDKQAKIQHLMSSGMPTPVQKSESMTAANERDSTDPQAIRRKQMQTIMMDASLTQPEKQLKMQQLMASGMPKVNPSPAVGAMDSTGDASGSSQPPPSLDPETIRRKQIQEVMMDPSLTARQKQVKTQELMASGMPKVAPVQAELSQAVPPVTPSHVATEDPETIRRKQIQQIMRDPGLTAREKQVKTQELMARGMPQAATSPAESRQAAQRVAPVASTADDPSSEDPEAVRRKQIQQIMRDPGLTAREKQVKTQELMAGGMPKGASSKPEPAHESPRVAPANVAAEDTTASDPEMIRRKQIQQIMRDPGLTAREKQVKMQELMASGMQKAAPSNPEPAQAAPPVASPQKIVTEAAAPTNPEMIRRKQIQQIMMDPNLSSREKQVKTQELMATGMPAVSENKLDEHGSSGVLSHSSEEEQMQASRNRPSRRGLRGKRNTESHDGASQRQASGGIPDPGQELGDCLEPGRVGDTPVQGLRLNTVSAHSALTENSHNSGDISMQDDSADTSLGDGSSRQDQLGDSGARNRISRRDRLAARETLSAAKAAGVEVDAREAVTAAQAAELPSMAQATKSGGFGGAPQGKMRRTTGAASRPGAVSVVEPTVNSDHQSVASGVGGAPQGKFRRAVGAPAVRPGAVSVVEPSTASTEPGVAAGVGGAPQGKMRRATSTSKPGAVSVVEPSTTTDGSVASTGLGGAPQGKFRRTVTSQATRPGAMSVVEPAAASSNEPNSSTGVGGAPQGKFRRSSTTPVSKPGAVAVVEPAAASMQAVAATGVGGAPQGKMRRTTSPSRPGAVSVVEPSSTSSVSAGATGVGGAPQGKFRRTVTSPVPQPGAVSVVEPAASQSGSDGPAGGVGGAPQGKFRRTTTSQATMPGAVRVAESSPSPSEPGAATGVGGAPQGKLRRTTNSGSSGVNVEGKSTPEAGAPTGVGGAPQGKFRRTTTAPASTPGAVSVVEPSAATAEPGATTTSVGGAPQGKFRRTSTAPASKPGAQSVVEHSTGTSEPGVATGVGGAPQGKFRRTSTAPASKPGAQSVVEHSAGPREPGVATGVGGAPQGKMRRSVQAAAPGAVSAIEPSTLEPEATSSVGGAPQGKFRRTVTAPAPRAGAQSVIEPSLESTAPGAAPGVVGAPQGKFRRSRASTTAPALPGAMKTESGASSIDGLPPRHVIDVSKESRMVVPAVTVFSAQPTEQGSTPGSEVSATENSMLQKSHPGAGAGNLPPLRGLRSSTHSAAASSLHDSISGMSSEGGESGRGLISKQAQGTSMLSMSHASFASESEHVDPADDSDFNYAVQLVEDDLQVKMRMREEAQNGTVVGFQPQAQDSGFEEYGNVLNEDPRYDEEQPVSDEDEEDLMMEKEKEMIRIGAESGSQEPTALQNRMEQKILQMEREQASRDDKLEELEELNARSRGHERRKEEPNPHIPIPEMFHDESEPIENGFLNPDPEAIRQAEEDGLAIAIAVDEEEEPDVYDVELKMYDPGAKPPFYKNRRFRCYSALICLLTAAAIITAGVVSAQKGSEVILITHAPSAAPSAAPTTTRETAVRGELARVIGDVVNEPGTPHEKALDWILDVDPMLLDEFSENLIQRYTLALFYYQTSEDNSWTSCNPPADGEDFSCIFLDFTRHPDNSVGYVARNDTPEVRWLSEKHECEWAEVLCHPVTDGNVIGIDILGQNLTGTLPEELRHLDDLMWLSLSFNKFTGTIPEVYGEFPYMTIFEVTENLLTGQIPGGFFRQPNLLQLNPAYNIFTGTIPPEIGDLTTLHSLFFFGTEITGTLPTEMGRLEDVRNLWLFDNNGLTGPIPSEIGQLSLLEDLKLSNNGHSGPLPSEMGLLTNLEELFLAGSNMGGSTVPEELWNMSSIVFIDINGADLGGSISTNIGKVTTLNGLKASRNQFTGELPSEIGLLDDLVLLWIHVNEDLGGEVPIEVCRLVGPESLRFLNADCAGTVPRISCQRGCCTGCCDEFGQCQVV